MMRMICLGVAMAAALSACSPLNQCIVAAEQDVREVTRELTERRANLNRGYAIERIRVPEMVHSVCGGPGGVAVPCGRWDYSIEEIRHPINRGFEAERVALLERQLVEAEAQAERGRAQCRATYPD
ncbi:MAG: hypothetical protein ACK4GT_14270 [Pararhodobacter sp.]